MARSPAPDAVVVTAVLPTYRGAFVELLAETEPTLVWYTGSEHCDASVRTGVPTTCYRPARNHFLLGRRVFVQSGMFGVALRAGVTVLDLNPRSVTAWLLLLGRRVLRRRTIVWGHLYPRAGKEARTSRLRQLMRDLADGTLTYTLTDREAARESGGKPAWAATNALYRRADLEAAPRTPLGDDVLYVGRLVEQKKPELLLRAFALAAPHLPSHTRLLLVGEGHVGPQLKRTAAELHLRDRVVFAGPVYEVEHLLPYYAQARVSVSPGYVGLTLTQSLGFGVPMILPRDEPHAPEIELAEAEPLVRWCDRDSPESLAQALQEAFRSPPTEAARGAARERVMATYSADSMAAGFRAAIHGAGVQDLRTLELT